MKKYKIVPIYYINVSGKQSKHPWFFHVKEKKYFLWFIPYWLGVGNFWSEHLAQEFIANRQ